jgi:N-acetylneuraminic acid mutarotase
MFAHRSASKVNANISSTTKTHLIRGAFYLLLFVGICVMPLALGQRSATNSAIDAANISLAVVFFRSEPPSKLSERMLTFQQRVAFQRSIEEVYWRHRIWPGNRGKRPDLKPSFDAVMSQSHLENKVSDYLRDSQALQDHWQRPITAQQLQAEMDRMAQHTKQPEVLHELFEGLGNDPFVIAECLARPVLVERTLATVALVKESWVAKPETQVPVTVAAVSANYTLPVIASPSGGCIDDTWTATSTVNAPEDRWLHTAVWTGSEMIVWGGTPDGSNFLNTGGKYNPSTDSWTATSITNAPIARESHTAVWTGSEMIVWGGYNRSELNTGGRYNPSTDSWTATSTTNAPGARYLHTAVWAGSEMIVWGGVGLFNTGGRYNPDTDSWTATSIANAPTARYSHTAVWAGSKMIIWGGEDTSGKYVNTGGRYNPTTDTWAVTTVTNAPIGRVFHRAVWTSSEMIVWGGANGPSLNTGGKYNPSTDSWTATSIINAPSARTFHTSVWTGSEMIVWGGYVATTYFNSGGRYNPSTDSWTTTSIANVPSARAYHSAIWTWGEMIVWGGLNRFGVFNTGGRYCAQLSAPTPTPTPTATATPTLTPNPTPTATPTPMPTARPTPIPRSRPSPAPRR